MEWVVRRPAQANDKSSTSNNQKKCVCTLVTRGSLLVSIEFFCSAWNLNKRGANEKINALRTGVWLSRNIILVHVLKLLCHVQTEITNKISRKRFFALSISLRHINHLHDNKEVNVRNGPPSQSDSNRGKTCDSLSSKKSSSCHHVADASTKVAESNVCFEIRIHMISRVVMFLTIIR